MSIAKKIIFILAVMACIGPVPYSFAEGLTDESWTENAWNELEGRLHDKGSLDYYYSNNDVTYNHVSAGNNIEFDLTESFTIYNSIYYKYLREEYSYPVYDFYSTDGSGKTVHKKGSAYGMDDIDVGIRHRILDGEYGLLSQKVNVSIPGPYDENTDFALGDGKYKVNYRIFYGYSLSRLYLNLSTGYNWRSGNLSDQLHYSGAIVGKISQAVRVRVKLDGTFRIKEADENNNSSTPKTERVDKNTANGSGIFFNNTAESLTRSCGGNGSGFSSDTSLTTTTVEHRNMLTLSFGMMVKLTNSFGLDLGYKPAVHSNDIEQDASYSAGIYYMLI